MFLKFHIVVTTKLITTLDSLEANENKVVTTMVIRPLSDRTYCAQSVRIN